MGCGRRGTHFLPPRVSQRDESQCSMTVESNSQDARSTEGPDPSSRRGGCADLISPVLYDLVLWGFTEENSFGQRVLRRDIQARLNAHEAAERELNELEGNPLYVGYRCQACWEAAVTLVTYGQHLCAWGTRPVGALPDRPHP